jgi:hypothetical protein
LLLDTKFAETNRAGDLPGVSDQPQALATIKSNLGPVIARRRAAKHPDFFLAWIASLRSQ